MSHVKLVRSNKAEWLVVNKPNAWMLFTIIALRARWSDCPYSHIKAGWAFIGDYDSCGLTRKEYRNALEFLVKERYIEIICKNHKINPALPETSKTGHQEHEIRAIERATNGTLVNIVDDSVWDVICPDQKEINQKKGHQKGQHYEQKGATEGPPRGHKQEDIKEEIKNYIYQEEVKEEVATSTAFSSLSHKNEDIAFFSASFDPDNITFPDGSILTKRTQNAFAKYKGLDKIKLHQNMCVFFEDLKKGTFKLKRGKSYEEGLQGYIKLDIATLRQRTVTNSILAQFEKEEKGIRGLIVLKTVVQVKISKEETWSIKLEEPEDKFSAELEKAIDRYFYKTKQLKEAGR